MDFFQQIFKLQQTENGKNIIFNIFFGWIIKKYAYANSVSVSDPKECFVPVYISINERRQIC